MPGDHIVAVVLAGGDAIDASVGAHLPAPTFVIAADSGLHHAPVLGLHVDVVVGDLDSVSQSALDDAVAAGARVEQHPSDKDATDLELALDVAVREGATEIHVVGGGGGRVDHLIANLLLLSSPAYASIPVRAHLGAAAVSVLHGGRSATELVGAVGSVCTLVPVGGPARGIVTDGLQYPLRNEALDPGTSRGVSNVLVGERATVALGAGTLLAVQPVTAGVGEAS